MCDDPFSRPEGRDESVDKELRIRHFMADEQLDALLLRRISSFAWATNGAASFVNTAAEVGEAALLLTPTGRFVITNNIEAPRLTDEEGLAAKGWEIVAVDWWTSENPVRRLTAGLRLGADGAFPGAVDVSGSLSRARAKLSPEEGERFRNLGSLCARAMSAAIPRIAVGMSEYEIAALVAEESVRLGVYPIVQQVAVDDRAFLVRHAIPTEKRLSKYALIALCGRKNGLVASLSRALHYGPIPPELSERQELVARVDAELIRATRPGAELRELFAQAQQAYASVGYPKEWQAHHQGGAAGYEPREYLALPTSLARVVAGQAYAWNPSISGTKSEDTILVNGAEPEVLTATDSWPRSWPATDDGRTFPRSGILEL